MEYSAFTHQGLVRPGNEDSYCMARLDGTPGAVLAAVADGMGGHEGGEVASSIAVSVTESVVSSSWNSINPHPSKDEYYLALVFSGAVAANRRVHEESLKRFGRACMGTTLTVAIVKGDMLYVAHAGDSRAYVANGTEIRQITDDHSLVGEMVRGGDLTEREAMIHPSRNILTNALGTSEEPRVDLYKAKLSTGDTVILCTDGLTNLVSKEEIQRAVNTTASLDDLVRALVELANSRGGYDNTTVVAIRSTQGGELSA
ncbi:MAG: Stp1/IreP family PP2C-type Ser/Thr phosphatase [Firmicutes bacterium]|nr:Stp1/IreP family PP2C-type Ser/Thr phosphatase [Bacillota bacterium]